MAQGESPRNPLAFASVLCPGRCLASQPIHLGSEVGEGQRCKRGRLRPPPQASPGGEGQVDRRRHGPPAYGGDSPLPLGRRRFQYFFFWPLVFVSQSAGYTRPLGPPTPLPS